MSKTFITFLVVFVSFGLGVVLMTLKGATDGLDLLAIPVFIFVGWYATKFNFGKLDGDKKN